MHSINVNSGERMVRPTFSTTNDLRAPASGAQTRIMVALAFTLAALFYVAAYYVGAWIFSLLR